MASSLIRVLRSGTLDPVTNVATEEWLFRTCRLAAQQQEHSGQADAAANEGRSGAPVHTLFVWRNEPTVFIGRNQNPWRECHVQRMEDDGVHLVRRYSGGGAVYQDPGNTNFTFISPKAHYSASRNVSVVQRALKRFGVDVEPSGRNDLVAVGAGKVSGSAYKYSGVRSMHHGTLLLSVDMSRLGAYLNPDKRKLQSKGVKSVVARVSNIAELAAAGSAADHGNGSSGSGSAAIVDHDTVCQALVEAMAEEYSQSKADVHTEMVDEATLAEDPVAKRAAEQMRTWDWRFGQTPDFDHVLETRVEGFGNIEVHLDAQHGRVSRAQVFSDTLYADVIDDMRRELVGVNYDAAGMRAGLQRVAGSAETTDTQLQTHLRSVTEWLCAAI